MKKSPVKKSVTKHAIASTDKTSKSMHPTLPESLHPRILPKTKKGTKANGAK